MSASFDAPSFISHYKNHLFLGFTSGSLINSSLGEPLEYATVTGAGEIAFGEQITGLLTAASTSLVIFAAEPHRVPDRRRRHDLRAAADLRRFRGQASTPSR